MRAFVLKEPGVVGYVDVPEPRLTPYGAILRPVAVAPCSSDVHTVFGGGSRKAPNLVLGHECVAEVLENAAMMAEVAADLTVYTGGDCLPTDDRAPVEVLGMRVLDELIAGELDYYRENFSLQEILGMLG